MGLSFSKLRPSDWGVKNRVMHRCLNPVCRNSNVIQHITLSVGLLSVNISNINRRWVLASCSDGCPIASVVVCTPERRDPRPRLSALSEPNNSDYSVSVIDSSVIQTALYGLSVVHWHLCNLCGCVLPLLATRSSSPLASRVCSFLHTRSSEIVRSYSAEGWWIQERVFWENMRVFLIHEVVLWVHERALWFHNKVLWVHERVLWAHKRVWWVHERVS